MDQLLPVVIPPGMRNTGTVYQSKGRWYTGNFVRFFQDTIQPIGGWTSRTLTGATITGVPRAAVSFRINVTGDVCIVLGTTTKLFVIVGSVVYDITPASLFTGAADTVWHLDSFGGWLVALADSANSKQTGSAVFVWKGNTASAAVEVDNTDGVVASLLKPRGRSLVVTPERFLVVLGAYFVNVAILDAPPTAADTPNDRNLAWADQETTSNWAESAVNKAGAFPLSGVGSLLCGRRGRGNTLLWTRTDLWGMTYIGGTLVYRFDQLGNNCGVISGHAAVTNDAAAFWMGQNGFYMYDGFVKPIPCDVQDYVFGSLNRTYTHYIWALENPTFGEITWFYPSGAATEVDRYVTYNYRENHWVTGSLQRTCGVSFQETVSTYPVMTNAAGTVFDHETGSARNSEGTPSLESGPIELGKGDRLMAIHSILPDDKTVGDVNLTIYTAPNPDTAETSNGPFTLTARTTLRVKARQLRLKFTEAVATSWRVGVVRLGVIPSSRR